MLEVQFQKIHLEEVDSTSRYLKDYCVNNNSGCVVVCVAQKQTGGYGQQGRSWLSMERAALFSIAIPLEKQCYVGGVFSLWLAMVVHKSLSRLTGKALRMKWPNDIYCKDKKAAGILVEQVASNEKKYLIIGVGVNKSSMDEFSEYGAVGEFETGLLVQDLVDECHKKDWANFDFQVINQYWHNNDYFSNGELLRLKENNKGQIRQVVYRGVMNSGAVQVECLGKKILLTSGANSLRKLVLL